MNVVNVGNTSATSPGSRAQNQRTHIGEESYECIQCKKAPIVQQRIHTEERYKCDERGKRFHVQPGLVLHQSKHTQTYEGGKPCSHKPSLHIQHTTRLTQDKSCWCSVNGKIFYSKSDLVKEFPHRRETK